VNPKCLSYILKSSVNGQPHGPVALSPVNEAPLTTERKSGMAPQLVWKSRATEVVQP